MITMSFILFLLVLMVVVSTITTLVIEVVKKIVSADTLIRYFKKMEIFALVFTFIVALITYLVYLLFIINNPLSILEIIKLIVIGFIFLCSCGAGSQIGYDKVIKTIKDIIALLGGSHAIQ